MCIWFSCITRGDGKLVYFCAKEREAIRAGLLEITGRGKIDMPDSHSVIAAYYGIDVDRCNKYEFNPLSRKFAVNEVLAGEDRAVVERKLRRLDYSRLAPPEMRLRPLTYPLQKHRKRVTEKDKLLLREWANVHSAVREGVRGAVKAVWATGWNATWDAAWAAVRATMPPAVEDAVRATWVGDAAWEGVRATVWEAVVEDAVRATVWAAAGDAMWAYIGSYFDLPWGEAGYPYQSAVDLWERGLVPSFDGQTWRLHGDAGKILFSMAKEVV